MQFPENWHTYIRRWHVCNSAELPDPFNTMRLLKELRYDVPVARTMLSLPGLHSVTSFTHYTDGQEKKGLTKK